MPRFLISQLKRELMLASLLPVCHPTLTRPPLKPWAPEPAPQGGGESPLTLSPAHSGEAAELGSAPAVPGLDKPLLSGIQKCFSRKPVSSLFIPTVAAVEWKVMYSKLSCELFDLNASKMIDLMFIFAWKTTAKAMLDLGLNPVWLAGSVRPMCLHANTASHEDNMYFEKFLLRFK